MMKKCFSLILLLTVAISLAACSKQSDSTSEQASTTVTSQEESTTSKEKELTEDEKLALAKEDYATVFEDYEQLLAYAASGKDATSSELFNLVDQLNNEVNSWVAEAVVNNPTSQRYAFYDLDQNGSKELLLASLSEESQVFLTGFYYLTSDQANLLAQGFTAGQGGSRNVITLYTDGTVMTLDWYSGTGQG